jgi:hypothetical protein
MAVLAGVLLAACGPKPHAASVSQIPPFLQTPVAKRTAAASAATVEHGRTVSRKSAGSPSPPAGPRTLA